MSLGAKIAAWAYGFRLFSCCLGFSELFTDASCRLGCGSSTHRNGADTAEAMLSLRLIST